MRLLSHSVEYLVCGLLVGPQVGQARLVLRMARERGTVLGRRRVGGRCRAAAAAGFRLCARLLVVAQLDLGHGYPLGDGRDLDLEVGDLLAQLPHLRLHRLSKLENDTFGELMLLECDLQKLNKSQ